MNRDVVCRLSDSFPAEGLVMNAEPKYPWQPFDDELADRLNMYPAKERATYFRSINAVLRAIKLKSRIENMRPRWSELTPLEILRQLEPNSLKHVSRKNIEWTIELVK